MIKLEVTQLCRAGLRVDIQRGTSTMANERINVVGTNIAEKATMIWNVADMLRGPFKPHEYGPGHTAHDGGEALSRLSAAHVAGGAGHLCEGEGPGGH